MQIKNNYQIEWKLMKNNYVIEEGTGVFNGDFGYIEEIDEEDGIIEVLFEDGKKVIYEFKQADELKLAYATTIHKSQGSEFPAVIIPAWSGPPMLLTRNLFYTAITRARDLVVLVGEQRYITQMIRNNLISKRYSSLDKKIKDYFMVVKEFRQ
jgi:exodeoxyribonuclease V alpha subunit